MRPLQRMPWACVAVLLGSICLVLADEEMYCGERNCYDVLGLKETASPVEVKTVYRKMSRSLHPDKNPSANAAAKFAVIARAYEILSDPSARREYDYALKYPEFRAYNSARYYYRQYYTKHVQVNPLLVIAVTLLVWSGLQYWSQSMLYTHKLNAVRETPKYQQALKELKKQKAAELDAAAGVVTKKGKKPKKALENIEVDEKVLIDSIKGLEEPKLGQMVIFTVWTWPYHLLKGALWQLRWYIKYSIRKEDYTQADKEYITRAVTGISGLKWDSMDEYKRQEYMAQELWIRENEDKFRRSAKGQYMGEKYAVHEE